MADKYRFTTMEEAVFVAAQLDDESRKVFLAELSAWIQTAAAMHVTAASLGQKIKTKSVTWVNGGRGELRVRRADPE